MAPSAVVLAAGRGTRLREYTQGFPKCLVPVAGRPLIHYALNSLAEAGIRRVIVVAGYRQRQVLSALGDGRRFGLAFEVVSNPEYWLGNASSLGRALRLTRGEQFLLTMADHIVSPELFHRVLTEAGQGSAIAVDRSPLSDARTVEATKVASRGDLVTALGKGLREWDGIDTGVSVWCGDAFDGSLPSEVTGELAALMTRISLNRPVQAVDVSGCFWMDVDTPEDIHEAEVAMGADAGLLV